MLINMDLVQAKEKLGKSKCQKTIMKLPFLSHCMVLDTERLLYGACDTQAQTRPVVGEMKLCHYVFSQRKHIPFSKGLEPKQVRQVSDASNVRAAVLFSLSDSCQLQIHKCVSS